MKWTTKKVGRTEIGIEYRKDDLVMFFGDRNGTIERLQKAYPNFEFRFLTQVHGTECIPSDKAPLEADAHFTNEHEVALCIRTADCTPILVASDDIILAIHAGWRGVFHRILSKCLQTCFADSESPLIVAMGPHIQKGSFEVDKMLGNEFALKFGSRYVLNKRTIVNKSFVDLKSILKSQLAESGLPIAKQWYSAEDTLKLPKYFSHRAQPSDKGRNISFVARL